MESKDENVIRSTDEAKAAAPKGTVRRLRDDVGRDVRRVEGEIGAAGSAARRGADRVGDDSRGAFERVGDATEGSVEAVRDALGTLVEPELPSAAEIDAARADLEAASAGLGSAGAAGAAAVARPAGTAGAVDAATTGEPAMRADGGRDWLSMSNDNTTEGRQLDVANGGPITLVRDGMRVVDVGGEEIGKVETVRMGDPGAATASDRAWRRDDSIIDALGRAVFYGSGDALPETVRNLLLRVGYIYIDGKGWFFDRDCFASAEQIDRVEGDTVFLNVPKEDLPVA